MSRASGIPGPAGTPTLAARLLAEFVGTFALVFAGTGAIVVDAVSGGAIGHVGIALTFGLVIAVFVYAYKDLSGAQYNPAVSAALWLRGVFPGREVAPYVAAQLAGALAASGIVALGVRKIAAEAVMEGAAALAEGAALVQGATSAGAAASAVVVGLGATVPGPGGALVTLPVEVLATFLLVTVILGVVRAGERANPWAGIAIGGTVALCALAFGPISGASMNPARSFGPIIFAHGAARSYWLYVVGPVVGGIIAVLVDRAVDTPVGLTTEEKR